MSKNNRLTPKQRAFCDAYLASLTVPQAMIPRKMLRFANNFLRFLTDFEPRKCGPFSKHPPRIAKNLRSARNESRPIKTMYCGYLRRISSARCNVLRLNIVPTQTPRNLRSRAQPYGLLITPGKNGGQNGDRPKWGQWRTVGTRKILYVRLRARAVVRWGKPHPTDRTRWNSSLPLRLDVIVGVRARRSLPLPLRCGTLGGG